MKKLSLIFIVMIGFVSPYCYAKAKINPAVTQPIPVTQLESFSNYPESVKKIITDAEKLSQMNLTYQFGSSDPKNKGMDCSGTIYYLLQKSKLKNVPRDSEEMFAWVNKKGKLHRVTSKNPSAADYSALKPGDLLFWSGTYATSHSISHVMLYLGKNKAGQALMFGSSDGRSYQGKKMWGVSVFDFKLPDGKDSGRFEGYSCIPDLTCS